MKRFLEKHKTTLIKIGLPLTIIEDDSAFNYLIEHGYCFETHWTPNKLCVNKIQLLEVITSEYSSQMNLFNVLGDQLNKRLSNIKANLDLLAYDFKWIEYGFLNEDLLNTQIEKYNLGEDLNAEHYRYVTFKKYLKAMKSFSDQDIEKLLELALLDEDKGMSSAVVTELARNKQLTEKQFNTIIDALRSYGKWTEKTVHRLLKNKSE